MYSGDRLLIETAFISPVIIIPITIYAMLKNQDTHVMQLIFNLINSILLLISATLLIVEEETQLKCRHTKSVYWFVSAMAFITAILMIGDFARELLLELQ